MQESETVQDREHPQVHEHEGKWWFWDEAETDRHGPYESKKAASVALELYASQL